MAATKRGSKKRQSTTRASAAKELARRQAEGRRARADEGGQDARGRERNLPNQLVHQEGERAHRAHHEDTDRQIEDINDVEGRDSEILEWRRHSDLDAPPPREGFVNRFIRVRLGTVRDTGRLRAAIREGWRPVKASSVDDRTLPNIHLEQFGDVIGVEDLILCEMPKKVFAKRKEFYSKKAGRQRAAISRQLDEQSRANVPGFGPIQQQRSSSVTVRHQPRQVAVADDEV